MEHKQRARMKHWGGKTLKHFGLLSDDKSSKITQQCHCLPLESSAALPRHNTSLHHMLTVDFGNVSSSDEFPGSTDVRTHPHTHTQD